MLDTERYDAEPGNDAGAHGTAEVNSDPAEAGRGEDAAEAGGPDGEGRGRGRGLFRRGRRAATRPAGPPEQSEVPEVPGVPPVPQSQAPQVPSAQPPPVAQAPQMAPLSPRSRSAAGAAQPQYAQPSAAPAPLVMFRPPDMAAASRPPAQGGATAAEPEPAEVARPSAADEQDDDGGSSGPASSRRRRRGGRGRGRGTGDEGSAEPGGEASGAEAASPEGTGGAAAGDEAAAPAGEGPDGTDAQADAAGKRRRRRRRTGSAGEAETPSADDPPNTVVHVRSPRSATAVEDAPDVKGVKGSTRLEAKRQRRREGRESGRRRPPVITESEFLARREAVERVMVVRQHADRTQIAVLEDGVLVEHYVDRSSHQSYVGNVYLGRVQNVLPSMEAAFVDIGKGRNAVLYAGEVNFDASGLEGESKRIESALKSGQSIVVQVTKDPIGHKGARLTSQVSLPGRYLVYVPGASMTGISRKLPDTERTRLKSILKQVMPEDAGMIVRTAAEGATEEELSHDVARLTAQWEAIERKAKSATAPELLYGEPDLTIRVVRDVFNEDFTKLVIASDGEWDMVDDYVRYVAPGLADRLERWSGDEDVFAAYRIDEQLGKALERKVWLPSGGSLVIDTTEAMTVIDVNTGKFTGQGGNLEQTVTRNNLEAAEEIVRQLRVRDVGGIIVIDFIDMVLESNRDLVLRRLLECLARDRTKHQVAEVTSLGLVQMTRKRVGSGLLEAFSIPCECCNGRGVIISMDPVDHSAPDRHSRDHAARSSAARSMAAIAASRGSGPGQASDGAASEQAGTATATADDRESEAPDTTTDGAASSSRSGRRRRRGGSGRGGSASQQPESSPAGPGPAEGTSPADDTGSAEGTGPAEDAVAAEGTSPADDAVTTGTAPAEGSAPTEGSAPAEGSAAAEDSAPAEGSAAAEGGAPADAGADAEGASATDSGTADVPAVAAVEQGDAAMPSEAAQHEASSPFGQDGAASLSGAQDAGTPHDAQQAASSPDAGQLPAAPAASAADPAQPTAPSGAGQPPAGAADPAQPTAGPDPSEAGAPDAYQVTTAQDAGSPESAEPGAGPEAHDAAAPEAHQPSAAQNGSGPDSAGQNPATEDGAALLGQEADRTAG
jgi:ribonuclease E